jgi:hypothetical protein
VIFKPVFLFGAGGDTSNIPYDTLVVDVKEQYTNLYLKLFKAYKIINKTLTFEQSQFIDQVLYNEFSKFNKYIYINEPELDIKISFSNSNKLNNKLINIIYSTVKLFKQLYGNQKIELDIALCSHKRSITTRIIGSVNVNGNAVKCNMVEEKELKANGGPEVKGYPTLLYSDAAGKVVEFSGPRNPDGFMQFLKQQVLS